MSKKHIDETFNKRQLKLMNHVVAGFPNPEACLSCIKVMEENGSDMVEIQIPFSDPMADGPTIVKANHVALAQGMNVKKSFAWIKQVRKEVKIPLLIMTYYNLAYQMGLDNFFSQAVDCGISGIIIPDIPFDEPNDKYLETIANYDLHPIQVVSPTTTIERLKKISSCSSGFVYTTLKTGITGTKKVIDAQGLNFLKQVREHFSIPIAAGFGISSSQQVEELKDKVDMVVVGSHVIKLINDNPDLSAVAKFIKSCKV